MITTDDITYIQTGAKTTFDNPVFLLKSVEFAFDASTVGLRYGLYTNPFGVTSDEYYSFLYVTDRTTIDAKTASGTGDCDQFENVCDQVLEDYLSGITENSAVTFTIV